MTDIILAAPGDEALFDGVAPDLFDAEVRPDLLREFLADPRHHMTLAVDGGMIVGFASGVHYLHPDKASELFVNEVGVSASHRGQGVGRGLVDRLLAHGDRLGCRVAWVLTERDNEAANRLYGAAGGEQGAGEIVMYEFDLHDG